MEFRARRQPNPIVSMLLYSVVWVGVLSIAWKLLKPHGWLYAAIDLILQNEPTGFYYLGIAVLGVLAVKYWLDSIGPNAFRTALITVCAFAGSFSILSLLLPS